MRNHCAPLVSEYRPAPGIERMRVGTPPVIQMTALEAALDVWEGVDMSELRKASMDLQELFIAEVEARVPELTLASPRDPNQRGSQSTVSTVGPPSSFLKKRFNMGDLNR